MSDDRMDGAPPWARYLVARFAALEERFSGFEERFSGLEERFARVEARLTRTEDRVADLRRIVDRVEGKSDQSLAGTRTLLARAAGIEVTLGSGIMSRGEQNARMDEIETRLTPIERRMDLRDGPPS